MKVAQLCLTLWTPWTVAHQAPLSMRILQARILEWWPFPSPGDLPDLGIKPRSPTLQADSLPAEPPGKPKNTGVGSLSLLQGIFLTQESNWGLLYYRQILYQLNYQGSPFNMLHSILKLTLSCKISDLELKVSYNLRLYLTRILPPHSGACYNWWRVRRNRGKEQNGKD